MKRLVIISALASLLYLACGQQKIENVSVDWVSVRQIEATFPKTPKPLFLYVNQDGCEYCGYMDTIVLVRAEIAKYLNDNFTPVNINVDHDLPITLYNTELNYDDFFDLFKIEGVPAYYFFDTTGALTAALHKTLDVLTFKRLLTYVNGGYYQKRIPWENFLQMPDADIDTNPGIF
jgi:thioredoxin-related protein